MEAKELSVLKPSAVDYHAVVNENFQSELEKRKIDFSLEFDDRYYHGHDQSTFNIFICLYEKFDRIPDIVVWPKCHAEVVKVVELANKFDVAIIPFGGGTNVTNAVKCPKNVTRMIVSLDMTHMNKLLWLDEQSMLACFECGVRGSNLDDILRSRGFTMGHEPDSIEFSTLGGWIVTKSSGMKQQIYGNIEDIVVKVKFVTSIGVIESCLTPRHSTGPDFERLIFGSEGTLGVVTEAVVKIFRIPLDEVYGTILFPNMKSGLKFLKELSQTNSRPSNVRLVCNSGLKFFKAFRDHSKLSNKFKMIGADHAPELERQKIRRLSLCR